jgi:putative peptide zinc metalloprotease protein
VSTLELHYPPLPRIREGLTIQAVSQTEFVVKRSDRREYFSVGPQEAFLLQQLDGTKTREQVRRAFEEHFSEPLSDSDLQEFVDAVRPMGLFRSSPKTGTSGRTRSQPFSATTIDQVVHPAESGSPSDSNDDKPRSPSKKKKLHDQSLLFFRIPLFDPDRSLTRLVDCVPFLWTRTFVGLAISGMIAAFCILTANGREIAAVATETRSWFDAALFLTVMLGCTAVHEVAHGATLKFYRGEVHDTGVLFMFFTPCLYCNVSDAWLLPDKWKRLAVTAAGGFSDLCLWAAGVFLWRLTVPGTFINTAAFFVMTVCGGRSLLNFNPLLRLDGYYLLSDWLSIPNLRPRALDYWMQHLRWLLWGAAKPKPVNEARALLIYGFVCWCFALVFLDLIFLQFFSYMGGQFGFVGLGLVLLLMGFAFRRVFKGFFSGEFGTMLKNRHGRTAAWLVALLSLGGILFLVPVHSTTNGEFEVRPGSVVQIHIPVAGVVRAVHAEDGGIVQEGDLLAQLRSSTLESDITKTEDLLREVEANLARLTSGTRREELEKAKERIRRLTDWVEAGQEDLHHARLAHEQELLAQNHRIRELKAELEHSRQHLEHSESLYRQGALAGAQLREDRLQLLQIESRLAQSEASVSAFRSLGIRSREADVKRREQELEEAKDQLDLLLAGSRQEDIAAEQARKERVAHELSFLKSQQQKLEIRATASGIFSAPRLMERIGQAVPQDSLFCTIEQPDTSRVEIAVSEDEAASVKPGAPVRLKARAIPFETFEATVEGISATASKTPIEGRNVVLVHCQIQNPDGRLKSGMTGFGKIFRGWNSMGMILLTKSIRYVRTEFWW